MIWKALRYGALIAAIGAACLYLFGPYETVTAGDPPDRVAIAADPAAYLAAKEALFDDIRPGQKKQIIWAGETGTKTPLSVIYVHGFSASSAEIRPVPDRVATTLGANLVLTRLRGHGRDGSAMAEADAGDWIDDTAEALEIGRAVGENVLVIATSTGGTLAALAALDPAMRRQIKGIVFISPNFGINHPAAALLTFPAARYWVPLLFGKTRGFKPKNEDHAAGWTTRYPAVAVFPMAAMVVKAFAQDYSGVEIPALFYFSDKDQVVRADRTRIVAQNWGGPVALAAPNLKPSDDPSWHVITGDVLSPGTTDETVQLILDWVAQLPTWD